MLQLPLAGGPARLHGTATDDRSGVAYVTVEYCQAVPSAEGWRCGFFGTSAYGMATNDLECRRARRRCTWDLPLPSSLEAPMTPGAYLVTAQAVDWSGNRSSVTKPKLVLVA